MWKANTLDKSIMQVDLILQHLSLVQGMTLQRWKKAINCILLKEEGNHNSKRMGIVVLLEADHQFNIKWIGRHTMKNIQSKTN